MEALESEILAAVRQLDESQQQRLLIHIGQMVDEPSAEELASAAEALKDLYVPGGPLDLWGELADGAALAASRAKAG